MLKVELVVILSGVQFEESYRIDPIVQEYEHSILRLAPNQCNLNPIEMI